MAKRHRDKALAGVEFKIKIMLLGAHGCAEPSCLLSSLQIF